MYARVDFTKVFFCVSEFLVFPHCAEKYHRTSIQKRSKIDHHQIEDIFSLFLFIHRKKTFVKKPSSWWHYSIRKFLLDKLLQNFDNGMMKRQCVYNIFPCYWNLLHYMKLPISIVSYSLFMQQMSKCEIILFYLMKNHAIIQSTYSIIYHSSSQCCQLWIKHVGTEAQFGKRIFLSLTWNQF